jgi:hypothetical protein
MLREAQAQLARLEPEVDVTFDQDDEDATTERGHGVALAEHQRQPLADDGGPDDPRPGRQRPGRDVGDQEGVRLGRPTSGALGRAVGLGETDPQVLGRRQPGVRVHAVREGRSGHVVGGPPLGEAANQLERGLTRVERAEQACQVVDGLADAHTGRRACPTQPLSRRDGVGAGEQRLDERVDRWVVPVVRTQPDGRDAGRLPAFAHVKRRGSRRVRGRHDQ